MAKFTETPGFEHIARETAEKPKQKPKTPESPYESLQRRMKHGLVESRDRFVKVSITVEVEDDLEKWIASRELSDPWPVVSKFTEQGLGVSLKRHEDEQFCCTLSDSERLAKDEPHLLSGWGPDLATSVFVALFKHEVLLDGVWDNVERIETPRRKYR